MKVGVNLKVLLAVPLFGLFTGGCAEHFITLGGLGITGGVVQPDAYVEGTHQPVAVYVTPDSAVCDVMQGETYAGTLRDGFGRFYLAKSKARVTVKCTAIGYEPTSTTIRSSLPLHAVPKCVLDALCEPAIGSGELNQYPGRVDVVLRSLQPNAPHKIAAAKRRGMEATAAPVPAETPTQRPASAASTSNLPPLPPAVQALRDGAPTETGQPLAAPADAPDAPLGTWRTKSDATRAWWGRDRPQSIAMPPTALLALQRTDGDWGLFDYRGKDGARGRVWIALDNVRLAD